MIEYNPTKCEVINMELRCIRGNLNKPTTSGLFECLHDINMWKNITQLKVVFDKDIYINMDAIKGMNIRDVAKLLIHELFHIMREELVEKNDRKLNEIKGRGTKSPTKTNIFVMIKQFMSM